MTASNISNILIVSPRDLPARVNELAEKVIFGLIKEEELNIVGIGEAVALSCMATNMVTEISNAHVNELTVDYIDIPMIGRLEAVFIRLGKKQETDAISRVAEEEKGMILSTDREGQVIVVSRDARLEALITICLIKLVNVEKLKIIAAGNAITDSVKLALRLTKDQISKDPVGVSFMNLDSVSARSDEQKKTTGIAIYLKKGCETEYSKKHQELLKEMKKTLIKS